MKRIYLNLKIAWRSLQSFRLRSILAVCGVFLGTFSLIVVSNLSASLARQTQIEAAKLGENLLIVRSGLVRRFGASTRLLTEATNLTLEDARAIEQGSSFVDAVTPSGNKAFPIKYKNVALTAILVMGVTSNYPDIRNFHPAAGTFFTREDDEDLARVVVLGKKVAEKLFGTDDPIGRYILIFRVPCQVIGVMEEKGSDASGADQDTQVFIPLNTYLRRFVNKSFVNTIFVRVTDEGAVAPAKAEIEGIIRDRHKIAAGDKDDFTVIDMKEIMSLKTQAVRMITVLGRISAGVSFLIGGIGILSIMILIVNERRMEIGIRRAVGSRKRDITLQFLMESSFISLTGGMVGVVAGFAASALISGLASLPLSVSPTGLAVSFTASVAVGTLAGIYPSRKATAIQPVDILRS